MNGLSVKEQQQFNFWHKWLIYACVLFGAIGILIALWPDNPMLYLWNKYFGVVFGNNGQLSAQANEVKHFMAGPLGGTILGSYILCFFVARYPFAERKTWAWKAIAISLLAWFILDSTISTMHGAYFNVYLINLFTLFVQGLPLIMLRKYFFN